MLFWDHCHSTNLTQINITFSYNYSFPNFLSKKNNWILIFGWDLMFAIITPWHVPQMWQFKAISDLINFVHFEITESICQKSPPKTTVTLPKKKKNLLPDISDSAIQGLIYNLVRHSSQIISQPFYHFSAPFWIKLYTFV